MPRECGLHRELRRVRIADLADHQHIRILPQQRAQGIGETETHLVIDLKLIDAGKIELDGIFHGADVGIRLVDLLEHGIERGRFTRAGRPGYQQQAVGLLHDFLKRREHFIGEPESFQIHRDVAVIDDADDRLFAEFFRHGRDAQIDGAAFQQHVDAAVLRQAALGDIQAGHDLEPADHGRMHLVRRA